MKQTGYDAHFKKMKKNTRFQVKKNSAPSANKPVGMPIQKRKKKQGFPIVSVLATMCILGGATYGYINPDEVDQIANKVETLDFNISGIEIGFLGQASAEEKPTEKNVPQTNEKSEKSADGKSLETKSKLTAATGLSPEEVALFNSLDDRKKQLDSKEADLKKLEEELHNQKIELEKRLAQLEQLRTQIGNQLQERVNTDAEQVDKLVAFYSSMKPVTAAKVIEKINEDLAVEVLRKMKKKNAAEIMNMIQADKAQRLSEKFAGYKVRAEK
jgi:flagellar motility protein MotE (MotC chaperone)